jgi:hypothetical protein
MSDSHINSPDTTPSSSPSLERHFHANLASEIAAIMEVYRANEMDLTTEYKKAMYKAKQAAQKTKQMKVLREMAKDRYMPLEVVGRWYMYG